MHRSIPFLLLILVLASSVTACRSGEVPSEGEPSGSAADAVSAQPSSSPGADAEGSEAPDELAVVDAQSGGAEAAKRAERLERITSGMWWHRDALRDAIGLEDAQSQLMDEKCRAHLRRRWALRKIEREQGGKALAEALLAVDLEAAERAAEGRRQRLAWLEGADDVLKLEILRVLRPEQLDALFAEAPGLARYPWLKTVSGRANARTTETGQARQQGNPARGQRGEGRSPEDQGRNPR